MNYWMLVSSGFNFQISRSLNFTLQGIKSRHRKKAERMEPGDRILYYLTGLQCFAGTATIQSPYFEDNSPIWESKKKGEDYPFRVKIKPDVILEKDEFISAAQIAPHMEYVRKWPPEHWHLAFQGNVHLLPEKDFNLVEQHMKKAASSRAATS